MKQETRLSKSGKRLPSNAWQPGCPSPNPKGGPRSGQSWSAVWRELTDLTADQLAGAFTDSDLGKAFRAMPKGVQMKYLVGARCLAALMADPQSAMLNIIMDREDGKVVDKVEMTSHEIDIENYKETIHKLYGPGSDFARRHKVTQDD